VFDSDSENRLLITNADIVSVGGKVFVHTAFSLLLYSPHTVLLDESVLESGCVSLAPAFLEGLCWPVYIFFTFRA